MWCSPSTAPGWSTALSKEAVRAGREVGCLIQVALDAGASERGERGGVAPGGVAELADLVAGAPGLRLDGLMTVAPLDRGVRRTPTGGVRAVDGFVD